MDNSKIEQIKEGLNRIERTITEIQDTIDTLNYLGAINASEWWKDGKYLYLVYPSEGGGKRRREYIGSTPEKIRIAQTSLLRYRRITKLEKEIAEKRSRKRNCEYHISAAMMALEGTQGNLFGGDND